VGCIIGKGGSKINEIRHMSASTIKIMEPGASGAGPNGAPGGSEGERLVVITGQPANIQMAVQLLYHVSFKSVSLLILFTKFRSDWNKRNRNNFEPNSNHLPHLLVEKIYFTLAPSSKDRRMKG